MNSTPEILVDEIQGLILRQKILGKQVSECKLVCCSRGTSILIFGCSCR